LTILRKPVKKDDVVILVHGARLGFQFEEDLSELAEKMSRKLLQKQYRAHVLAAAQRPRGAAVRGFKTARFDVVESRDVLKSNIFEALVSSRPGRRPLSTNELLLC
jgi:hypothetical protein